MPRVRPGEIKPSPLREALDAGGERRKKALATMRAAIDKHGGNLSYVAEELGLARMTLHRWFRRKRDAENDRELLALGDYARKLRGGTGRGRPASK